MRAPNGLKNCPPRDWRRMSAGWVIGTTGAIQAGCIGLLGHRELQGELSEGTFSADPEQERARRLGVQALHLVEGPYEELEVFPPRAVRVLREAKAANCMGAHHLALPGALVDLFVAGHNEPVLLASRREPLLIRRPIGKLVLQPHNVVWADTFHGVHDALRDGMVNED